MKPIKLLIIALCSLFGASCLALPATGFEKIHTEKQVFVHSFQHVQLQPVILLDANAFHYQVPSQPATSVNELHISLHKRSWPITWSIGKPDTKRHCHWQAFVRKLC